MTEGRRERTLRIHLMHDGATLPRYATPGAAGLDIAAALPDQRAIRLAPGDTTMVPTGLRMALPIGHEGQVRPRSGLAAKYGVTVLNAPGTIDADYRGEVKVILINHGQQAFTIEHGMRIAQLVVAPVMQCEIETVNEDELTATERGRGGFGSTGA